MKSVLLLEINEVPWKVLHLYLQKREYPELRAFFSEARKFSTSTVDSGELSPWITWPSFHRGMKDTEHKVQYLGQDPHTFRGTTIWEDVRKHHGSIGVFGSLQSWPPHDPGPGGFYVPDTFAANERTIPRSLEPLQRFNLNQVRANGRVIRSSPLRDVFRRGFLQAVIESGVRPQTIARLALQIIGEKFFPGLRSRRAIFQTVLFWDVFRNLYRPEHAPAFASFFTNHIASVQHRYWNHLFPEDLPEHKSDGSERKTFDFAFSVLDGMLADVRAFRRRNPGLNVIFASSMGQGPIKRERHEGVELSVVDTKKLLHAAGLKMSEFEPLLAMVPQVAAGVPGEAPRARARKFLESLTTNAGSRLFTVQEEGESLSITIHTPTRKECQAGLVRAGGKDFSFDDLGIRAYEVDAGTAYHIAEGVLAVAGPAAAEFDARDGEIIPADKVKGKILRMMGVSV